jgi:hypothetical protein
MKSNEQQLRQRKNKGSLSVFEEFAEPSGGGSILFNPSLEPESLNKIEERTKQADIPVSSRIDKADSSLSQMVEQDSPHDQKWRQTGDKLETELRTNQRQT